MVSTEDRLFPSCCLTFVAKSSQLESVEVVVLFQAGEFRIIVYLILTSVGLRGSMPVRLRMSRAWKLRSFSNTSQRFAVIPFALKMCREGRSPRITGDLVGKLKVEKDL